jgi:microcystin degradation protein MlrC
VVREFAGSNYKFGGKGPVLLVEPSDNIGGGAPGDGTDVMRALLKYDIQGGGVAIADAESVEALANLPIGGKITLPIGGKGSPLDPGPVILEVELVSRSNGVFELEDKNSHLVGSLGKIIDMGPSAVVKHRGLTILLTSKKLPPFDLGQWRSQGVNPEDLTMIGVKAAVGHRVAYGRIAAGEPGEVMVRAPDPTMLLHTGGVQHRHRVDHEPHQMIRRQPLAKIDRQQHRLIPHHWSETLRHKPILPAATSQVPSDTHDSATASTTSRSAESSARRMRSSR